MRAQGAEIEAWGRHYAQPGPIAKYGEVVGITIATQTMAELVTARAATHAAARAVVEAGVA